MTVGGTIAFDIETVVPSADLGTAALEDHELFCVCLGHRPAAGEPVETAVFVRDRWGPAGELAVLEAALEWLAGRPAERLLTYNGEAFDIPRLRDRTTVALKALDSPSPALTRLETLLATHEHVDLFREVEEPFERRFGHRPSFERVCELLGVDVPATPLSEYDLEFVDFPAHRSSARAMAPNLLGEDVPLLGARYLDLIEAAGPDLRTVQEIAAAIDHYARTDVEPLFALADLRPLEERLAPG